MVEGQVVTIGSSISATGNMLVSCNKPYVLMVDDVVWSPVGVSNNSDLYILSSGGLVEILVDDERIFFFRNSITPDFTLGRNEVVFKAGGLEGTTRGSYNTNGTYNQRTFGYSDIDFVQVVVYPVGGTAGITGLDLVASQGVVERSVATENYARFYVKNVDPTQYLSVKLGNVLVDFILPFEE